MLATSPVSRSTSAIATPVRRRSVRASCFIRRPRPGHDRGTGSGWPPTGLDPPHQPTQLAHGLLQQVGVGRVVDVGLHHGGVDPQLAGPQQLAGGQLGHQRGVQLIDHLGPAADQLDQRGRVRHRPVQSGLAENENINPNPTM